MSALEQAVLGVLLEHHPGLLSLEELVRHIAPDPADFADRDNVVVAIRELVQRGLAHRIEEFVFASAAAVYFERLQSAYDRRAHHLIGVFPRRRQLEL
jgi:hypothetical protein